jgi:hypothetical protein
MGAEIDYLVSFAANENGELVLHLETRVIGGNSNAHSSSIMVVLTRSVQLKVIHHPHHWRHLKLQRRCE